MPLLFSHSQEEIKSLAASVPDSESGAIVRFSGTVRKINHEKEVAYLFYEAYLELAKVQFAAIEAEAKRKFALRSINAVHLLGRASVGEVAVVIEVLAKHRAPAFLAARFLMDELKKNVPIWKCEYYQDGTKSWDQGLCQCAPEEDKSLEPVKKALAGQKIDPRIIAQKKVLLIGAGGLGCPLAVNLAALGIKNLAIFDGDVVSTTNLARQFIFARSDIGSNKALLIKEYLAARFSLTVEAHERMLDGTNARLILPAFDLVVEASDSLATKIMLAQYARVLKIPFISASVYQAEGEVTALDPAALGGCFSCFRKSNQGETCVNSGVLTHICSMVAAKASALALDMLAGRIKRPLMHIVQANNFIAVELLKDVHCGMCGSLKISRGEVQI